MVEEIGKLIRNGFETYTKNLNLSIPLILNFFITIILVAILAAIGFLYILGSSMTSLENVSSPQQLVSILLPLITQHIFEIAVVILTIVVVISFIQSFFTAGAIGMAKQATEIGKSELSTMADAGKKNVINLFLAEILVGLLSLAGIVFMIPGAMKVDITELLSSKNTEAAMLLLAGFLMWMLYLFIINLVLAVYRYALVIEGLDPIEGITLGFRFFNQHKSDVFILWLFIGVIIIVFAIIGEVMGQIPIISIIWAIINMIISFFIIPPLTIVWWVRLYMTRTDKQIYFNDLLAHPNDLGKT
jgi:hypothetical protein